MKIPNSAVGGIILLGWIGSLALAFSLYPRLTKSKEVTNKPEVTEQQLRAAIVALDEYQLMMDEREELLIEIDSLQELATENKVLRTIIDQNVGRNVVIRYQTNGKTRVYDRDCNCWVTR